MSAPVELKDGGICIRPEKMEKEKLYHCIGDQDKLLMNK